MLIWVDLANSPHVPFFRALIPELERRGHRVETTAREFAQTLQMAEAAGLAPVVIGKHGGAGLAGKAANLIGRAGALWRWARGRGFRLAVSHNSYTHVAAARALGIRTVTLMDYEHQPANHLAFRLASRVIVPRAFPEEALSRCGAGSSKVRRYHGTKEDVYLADFEADPRFTETLTDLGVGPDDVLVVLRPPAREALYHRFDNELFDELLARLGTRPGVKILLLARTESQRRAYCARAAGWVGAKLIVPAVAIDGANLIAAADLVISAGGTMNREAAALGIPAATIYAGRPAALDLELIREGRLQRISTRADLEALTIEKKGQASPRRALNVRAEIADLILS